MKHVPEGEHTTSKLACMRGVGMYMLDKEEHVILHFYLADPEPLQEPESKVGKFSSDSPYSHFLEISPPPAPVIHA